MKKYDSDGNPLPATTSSDRVRTDNIISWSNFSGTKGSRDITATKMNLKDTSSNEHFFYCPSSGKSGYVGGDRTK